MLLTHIHLAHLSPAHTTFPSSTAEQRTFYSCNVFWIANGTLLLMTLFADGPFHLVIDPGITIGVCIALWDVMWH